MHTLFLNCQDPCSPMRASWSAFASFDYAVDRKLNVRFDTPLGRLEILAISYDTGGAVTFREIEIPIDSWDAVFQNALRLRYAMRSVWAATVAEGLSRLAPLLETVGNGRDVTECLLENL